MFPSQGRDFWSLSSFTGRGLLLEVIRPRSWGNQGLIGRPSECARGLADVAGRNPFSRPHFRKRVKAATDRDSLPHTTLAEFRRSRVCSTERIEVQPAAERGRFHCFVLAILPARSMLRHQTARYSGAASSSQVDNMPLARLFWTRDSPDFKNR